jgi:hypothetical protein
VIWAETRSTPTSGGIIQVNRVGVRIYLAVGTGGLPAANFSIGPLSATRSNLGQTTVRTVVHNTGGWPLGISGSLRVTNGPGGLSVSPLPVRLERTLTAGGSESLGVALNDRIPAGRWHIRIALQGGGLERSADTTLMLPGATPHSGWLLPAIGLLAVLIGIAALLVELRRRRRRPEHSRSTWW